MTLTTFPDALTLDWRFAQPSQPAPVLAPANLQWLGFGERYQFCREALRPFRRLNATYAAADKEGAEAVLDWPAGVMARRQASYGLQP